MTSLAKIHQILDNLHCQYAFYYNSPGIASFLRKTGDVFLSASMIKVPILLAWAALERAGQVDRHELCDLDAEPQVQGAGYSWLLGARRLPYQDVLLMMIALSDNLCTNLVIRRVGLERLNAVFHGELGLSADTRLERKLFDYEARARGLDNYIAAGDSARLFLLMSALSPADQALYFPMFAVNQDAGLFMRDIQRDTLTFYHKTGSITGVLHDWGWTDSAQIFLLTQAVEDELAVTQVFGELGRLLLPSGAQSD